MFDSIRFYVVLTSNKKKNKKNPNWIPNLYIMIELVIGFIVPKKRPIQNIISVL